MKHWDLIRIFSIVADAGSLTKAAEILHVSQPSVSRSIIMLEERLGVKLFNRLARGLSLTREGCILYEGARSAYHHLTKAGLLLHESEIPQGALTIATVASTWVLPYLMGFIERHPRMQVKIQAYHEGISSEYLPSPDVIIGPLTQLPKNWVHHPLTTLTFQLYATERYLAEHGRPRISADLSNHRVLLPDETAWPLLWQGQDKPKAQLYLSNLNDLKNLALWDYGLALLPNECETEGLIHVPLFDLAPQLSLYYGYPEYLKASPRVMAFWEHLQDPLGGCDQK